jgi:hypothetical protein
MATGTPRATLGHFHVAYSIGLQHGILFVGLYVVATCAPLLISSYRRLRWFGAGNLVAVVVLARLTANGFASLWCAYAALLSGALALHLRINERDGHLMSNEMLTASVSASPPGRG